MNNILHLFYLIKCSVDGSVPVYDAKIDYAYVLHIAKRHSVLPIIYQALFKCDGLDKSVLEKYKPYFFFNLQKIEAQDYFSEIIRQRLTENKIEFMFIKGRNVSELYPPDAHRISCDVDVFYNSAYRKNISLIMKKEGFKLKAAGEVHDGYFHQPFTTFELHHFIDYKDLNTAYGNDFGNFVKIGDYEYKMSPEDLYVFMLAHSAKHIKSSGLGLRLLSDLYVMNKRLPLKRESVDSQLEKVGLLKYERTLTGLVDALFNGKEPDETGKSLLYFMLNSFSYGSTYNRILSQISEIEETENVPKFRLVLRRMFPPYRVFTSRYPVVKYLPFLLPVFWCVRLVQSVFNRRANNELKLIKKIRADNSKTTEELYKAMGLR